MLDASAEEILAVIDETVSRFLSSVGVRSAPIDAIQLACEFQKMELFDDFAEDSSRQHVTIRKCIRGKEIYLRSDWSVETRQWVAANAIGQQQLPALLEQLGLDSTTRSGGILSKRFAERLLTPNPWFARDVRRTGADLGVLKSLYATATYELIAERIADTDSRYAVALVDAGRVVWRASLLKRMGRKLGPSEQQALQLAHSLRKQVEVRLASGITTAWPLETQDRIFLVSVIDEDLVIE